METEVIEITDPGCSWAWGSEPKLRLLRWRYGDRVRWRRVLGGLIGDMGNYNADFDAEAAAPGFTSYWQQVGATTGMPHPDPLHWVYVSTEPACRAVKAAELQGEAAAAIVLRRLREATFVRGRPPDTPQRIADALVAVDGVDVARLIADLDSDDVGAAFAEDWKETRQPNAYVRELEEDTPGGGRAKHTEGHWRYVFPTVIVRGQAGEQTVPGWKPLEAYEAALEAATPGVTADPRPGPSAEELLSLSGTAAQHEFDVCCGPGTEPPSGAIAYEAGGGRVWLAAGAAAAWGVS